MKNIRISALLLTAALLLSLLAGCTRDELPSTTAAPVTTESRASITASTEAPVESEAAASEIPVRVQRTLDFLPETPIDMVKLSDIPYDRVDIEQLMADMDALAQKAITCENVDELLEAYREICVRKSHFTSMYTLALFRYFRDMADSYYAEEYKYCESMSSKLWNAYYSLFAALAKAPCAAELEESCSDLEGLSAYQEYSGENSTVLELEEQEAALLQLYMELTAAPNVEYDGETKLLNEWMQSDSKEVQNGALVAYITQYHRAIGEIYLELISVRQQIASLYGYPSYIDYLYDNNYYRDFTVQESSDLLENIKTYLAPVVQTLYQKNSGLQLKYPDSINGDPIGLLSSASQRMGGSVWEAFRFLNAYELYDIDPLPNKKRISFATYFNEYEAPLILVNPAEYCDVAATFAHEFGHFVQTYSNYGFFWDTESAETFSQSMVYLVFTNTNSLPEEIQKACQRMSLIELLVERVSERAAFADFENKIYALDPDAITLDQIDEIYYQCRHDFGLSDQFDETVEPMSWIKQHYFLEEPGYVISYAASGVAALQVCEKEAQEPGAGIEVYEKLLRQSKYRQFRSMLAASGLKSPFQASTLENIAVFLAETLDLNGISNN